MREPRKRQQEAAAARNYVAPVERSANIFDMPLDQFQGALGELAQQGVDTDALLRQYRSANSPFAAVNRAAEGASADLAAAGRRPVAGSAGLLSRPIDGEGGVNLNLGGGLLGMLSGAGRQIDAPMAAYQELIPAEDMDLEALGTAGAATMGGGAVTAPRGSLRAGLARSGDINADVAAARRLVLDNPNDAELFDQYKALRRERDRIGSTPEPAPATQFATPEDAGFAAYLERVNPQGTRIEAEARPNLMMGDMYGMLPRGARVVSERDGVTYYQGPDGATYATAFNPDLGEMDVVGFSMPGGNSTDLAVVSEMQGRGIGGELQYLMRSQDPYAQTGGLTDAGRGSLERTYNRLRDDGIVAANASQQGGLLATAASDTLNPSEQMARRILDMRAAGRASEVTDDMMAAADPQYMFNNTPLPMDEASRMARAGDAGFTTGRDRQDVMRELRGLDNPQLVHYTNKDFNEFRIPERENRQAIWATPDPNANLATKDNWRSFDEEGVNGIPIMARMTQRASPYEFRMNGDPMTPGFPRNVTLDDVAKANSVGADYAEAGLEYAIFDPRNIRSRFARFDPEFAHLANLNAANIDPMTGLFGAMAAEEQRRRRNAP